MFGISSKKWASIIFLLATILISLALVGIPFLVSGKSENFEGYQISNKGDIDGTSISAPNTFPGQKNASAVVMSKTAPVMPAIAIGGDYKDKMIHSITSYSSDNTNASNYSTSVQTIDTNVNPDSIFGAIFSLNAKENFSTITSF
jgi:flagellar basal body-associated protein FliL